MKRNTMIVAVAAAVMMAAPVCALADGYEFPLAETATLTGMISYPPATESEPNNRTIFKRLEEETNVHIDWTAIQSDQWGDKIALKLAKGGGFFALFCFKASHLTIDATRVTLLS